MNRITAKTTLKIIAVYFCVLWLFFGSVVFRFYDVRANGEVYYFRVQPVDPYDPFRGRYVAIQPDMGVTYGTGEYIRPLKDADGFVIAHERSHEPAAGYIKNLKLTRYYMNERLAPRADRIRSEAPEDVYIAVAIKAGDYVIKGMYVDGEPIEEYVREKGQ